MVDLRSDTVTRPTAAMRAVMAEAPVGDDVYLDDPTVRELEAAVADRLGFEAALFVSSGTMANQLAIALHTRPGDTVLTEANAHCIVFEAGGAAVLSGVQFDVLPGPEAWTETAMAAAIRPDSMHHAPTTMLVVENTHNVGGGRVLSVATMNQIARAGRQLGLAVHCDGARIWNAAVALGVEPRELLKGFDTAAVCFSKGLGAPVGSALVGPVALMERARKIRKRWGGAMRQVGIIAAGARHAMDHHVERLAADHRRAATLAAALRELGSGTVEVSYPNPGTNMVYFRSPRHRDQALLAALKSQGILLSALGGGWLRAVTHFDLNDQVMAEAAEAISTTLVKERL